MNEEITTLLRAYQRALNEADLDLVRSVYANDAIVIGQPFPTATGIQAIIALYSDFLSKLDFNVQFIVFVSRFVPFLFTARSMYIRSAKILLPIRLAPRPPHLPRQPP